MWGAEEVNTQVIAKVSHDLSSGHGVEQSEAKEESKKAVMLSIQGWRREAAKDTWQETPEADGGNHILSVSWKPKEENASRRNF